MTISASFCSYRVLLLLLSSKNLSAVCPVSEVNLPADYKRIT